MDANVATEATLSEDDILQLVCQKDDEKEDEQDDEEITTITPTPTSNQAVGALSVLHRYFESADIDDHDKVFFSLSSLDNALQVSRSRKNAQTKITDFFQ